jgi:hypothetical protein
VAFVLLRDLLKAKRTDNCAFTEKVLSNLRIAA